MVIEHITCKNCGEHVHFTDTVTCPECNSKFYGYTRSTLPEKYSRIIELGFISVPGGSSGEDFVPVVSPPEPVSGPDSIDSSGSGDEYDTDTSEFGWLIVHTEGKDPQDFSLTEGINYIGRPVPNIKPQVEVPDDIYVSRGHAVITVSKNEDGGWKYILTDNSNNQRGTQSKNGTHVNGEEDILQEHEEVELRDGDTIQIGETKLVLKTPVTATDVDEAKTQVMGMDYEKTIFKSN